MFMYVCLCSLRGYLSKKRCWGWLCYAWGDVGQGCLARNRRHEHTREYQHRDGSTLHSFRSWQRDPVHIFLRTGMLYLRRAPTSFLWCRGTVTDRNPNHFQNFEPCGSKSRNILFVDIHLRIKRQTFRD